jgi:hypothetical protein
VDGPTAQLIENAVCGIGGHFRQLYQYNARGPACHLHAVGVDNIDLVVFPQHGQCLVASDFPCEIKIQHHMHIE